MEKLRYLPLNVTKFLIVILLLNFLVFKGMYHTVMIYDSTFLLFSCLFILYGILISIFTILYWYWRRVELNRDISFQVIKFIILGGFVFPQVVGLSCADGLARFYVASFASEPFTERLHCFGGSSHPLFGYYRFVKDENLEDYQQFGISDWCRLAYSPSYGGAYIQVYGFQNSAGRKITKVSFLPDDPRFSMFHGQEISFVKDNKIFGISEELRITKYLDFKGPLGQRLALGTILGTYRFVFGFHIQELATVIIPISDNVTTDYYPISESQIDDYQKDGLLSTPLPKVKLDGEDYFWGYLGWLIIPLVIFVIKVSKIIKRRKLKKEQSIELKRLQFVEKEQQRQKNHDRRKRREAGQASAKKRWFKRP